MAEPFLVRAVARLQRKKGNRMLYAVAAMLFVASTVYAFREISGISLHWGWLGIAALLAPITLLLNGAEYEVAGRILGHRVRFAESFRIAVLSSAANLLPLPGSFLVKTEALKRKGSGYPAAGRANAALSAGWVTTSLLLAGAVLAVTGQLVIGVIFLVLATASAVITVLLIGRPASRWLPNGGRIAAVESGFVIVSSLRIYAVLHGIGVGATFPQSLVLALAGAMAALGAVFPAGLGLREVIAGALSPLVGLEIAAGVLCTAVDRLVGRTIQLVAALVLMARPERPEATTAPPETGASSPEGPVSCASSD